MRAVDIIIRKRDGAALAAADIRGFINGYLAGEIADYQASAFLMAVFLKGLDPAETAALTDAMMRSGDVYDLDPLGLGITVDKHSTGGVGDKISLILAPLVAACGVAVPMVSGRGLGHTGGTLDKLQAIPGFRIDLTRDEFFDQLKSLGVAMIGQTDNFVPADKKLYALRDVTGTIESVPLICASILSKKVASGAHALVMDVKCGSGAFMDTPDRARTLARGLVDVGRALGRPVRAVITDMNQPLGRLIGNSMEVIEAIDCLKGGGPADVRDLTLELAGEMLALGGKVPDAVAGKATATAALEDGRAWARFREMVIAQGGDVSAVDDPSKLPVPPDHLDFPAYRSGYLSSIDVRSVGNSTVVLGAGRARTTDRIDPSVGMEVLARIGDRVKRGQPLVRIFHNAGRGLQDCLDRLSNSYVIVEEPVAMPPLVIERLS